MSCIPKDGAAWLSKVAPAGPGSSQPPGQGCPVLGQEGQSHSQPSQGPAPASLCLLHGFQLRNKAVGRQMDDGFVRGFS